MKHRCCPYCQQTLPEIRLGVRLTPIKARIFDLVQRGGPDGITTRDLWDITYPDAGPALSTLKAHIWQINEAIEDSGYRIAGNRAGRGIWHLVHHRGHAGWKPKRKRR